MYNYPLDEEGLPTGWWLYSQTGSQLAREEEAEPWIEGSEDQPGTSRIWVRRDQNNLLPCDYNTTDPCQVCALSIYCEAERNKARLPETTTRRHP